MPNLNVLALRSRLIRKSDEHKGDMGKVLLVGGAPGMAGAIFLSAYGSLYSGAGWTIIGVLDSKSAHVQVDQPELMIQDASQIVDANHFIKGIAPDCLGLGPGLGLSDQALHFLEVGLAFSGPLILDADALNLIADHPRLAQLLRERKGPCTITPHPGEAARLLGISAEQVQANRSGAIQLLIDRFQCYVVLKGHHTLVGSPADVIYTCNAGNPGMATGGMGDVLTGLIASLAAQGICHHLNLWEASCLAVELHASAADQLVQSGIGPNGMTALELAKAVRKLINQA
ncbi:NAD(P)H-hydrate dehydratase [Polynucleobacter acidiphobus]|uniref:NAD(P)H-hydrate dehydratase n=1 Tax=Polynucleobacter acidiphobus TaxID=556053 RepID=UPI000D39AD47|nr:NAD(P)H-hydrate dehydratase [Polynucleobacter acidiphobus]